MPSRPPRTLTTAPATCGDPTSARDWVPLAAQNSIGTLRYYIAAIEANWLAAEIREEANLPPDLAAHLARLATARAELLRTLRALPLAEFHRLRALPDCDAIPERTLHQLMQPGAGHRGEIVIITALTTRAQ